MKDIQTIVNDKVREMIEGGAITEAIEKGIEDAISKAIDSQFKSYGGITKQIETALDDGLRINKSDLPFETYNQQMLVAVKAKLGNMFQGAASERFLQEIDNVLEPAPQEITLQELVEKVVSIWKTDEPWDAEHLDEYATVETKENDYGGISIKIWKQTDSSNYSSYKRTADLHLFITNDVIRINHTHSYNPTCFQEHEAFIFKLYAAGTKITGIEDFDADDCDLTLKDLEY